MECNTLCSEAWYWTDVRILSLDNLNLLPAVKTGANFDSSTDNLKQPQLPSLPTCDPLVKTKEGEEALGTVLSSGGPEEAPIEMATIATQALNQVETVDAKDDVPIFESSSPESSHVDEDFLDLLVNTLDGDFDPDLLI